MKFLPHLRYLVFFTCYLLFTAPVLAQTNTCSKLGVNLAVTAQNALSGPLFSANSIPSNFTEVLVTGTDTNDLKAVLASLDNSQDTIIIRLGAGKNSENISPQAWADFLNSITAQANKPFIATAGHNEPNCNEYRPLTEEKKFVEKVAAAANQNITLITGQLDYYCGQSPGATPQDYISAIANIPGIDGVALPFYTEVGGQNKQQSIALFNQYANSINKDIYITEIGADPNRDGAGDLNILNEALSEILTNPKVKAGLIFNGLCANPGFAYTNSYCSAQCLPLVSSCFGPQPPNPAACISSVPKPSPKGPKLTAPISTNQGVPKKFHRNKIFVFPEDPTEVAAAYGVYCGSSPSTKRFLELVNVVDETYCRGKSCETTNVNEIVTLNPPNSIPWYGIPEKYKQQAPKSCYDQHLAGSPAFYSDKCSQDFTAPVYRLSSNRLLYNQLNNYFLKLATKCNVYGDSCPVRPVAGFEHELDVFYQYAHLKSYDQFLEETPKNIQNLYLSLIPQDLEANEYRIAYLVHLIRKPKPLSNPEKMWLKLTKPDAKFPKDDLWKITRLLIPVTIGEDQHQGRFKELRYEPLGSLPDFPKPQLIEPVTYDSTLNTTAKSLQRRDVIDRQAELEQQRRQQELTKVHTAGLLEPYRCKGCLGSFAEVLIRKINANNLTCNTLQTPLGEYGPLSLSNAFLGAKNTNTLLSLFPPLKNIFQSYTQLVQSFSAKVRSVDGEGDDTAEGYLWLIAPEQTYKAEQLGNELLFSFYSQGQRLAAEADRNQKADIPSLYTQFLRLSDNGLSGQNDPANKKSLLDYIRQLLINKGARLGVDSPGGPTDAAVPGAAMVTAADIIPGDILRRANDPNKFSNSDCGSADNLDHKSDCFWKGLKGKLKF